MKLLGGLIFAAVLAVILASFFGTISIDAGAAWQQWLSGSPKEQWHRDTIILALRLPRIVLAFIAGGALAVAGAVMQTLLRNGLATPFTLGIASAGSFGAFLVMAFPSLAILGSSTGAFFALASALLCLLLVLRIARHSGRADGLLLAGITLNFLFAAGVMLMRFLADPFRLAAMERWMLGSVQVVNFDTALAPLPWLVLGFLLVAVHSSALDQLAFDEELAAARGVDRERTRLICLLGAGFMTAGVVAYTGPIGFLGLLVPHAIRRYTGLQHAHLLPACFLAGGAFLVLADLLARTVQIGGRHSELPVGIVTALVGGPFFLILLIRGGASKAGKK
jgi:cobalamin transport system permease protein